MSMYSKRIVAYMACLALLLISLLPCGALAAQDGKVTVAYIDYNSFITKAQDGSYSGYAVDYLDRIAEYTGWEYEFVDMDWPTAFEAVKAGLIDFYCVARQTKDRQADFDFSLYPVCNEEMNLYALPDSKLYYEDYEAFSGMRIGMLKQSGEIGNFIRYADANGFSCQIVEYPLNEAAVSALKEGEVDAIALVNHSVSGDFKLVGNFGVSPAYMMSRDGSEYMAQLSAAQEQLYFDDPDFVLNLEKDYYGDAPHNANLLLTRGEAEYIANAGEITVALSRDMAPIEYYNEASGVFRGVTVDLLSKISALTGLRFNTVMREDAPRLRERMEYGEVTLVGAMARNVGVSKALGIKQSKPFSDSTFSLVTKDIATLTLDSPIAVPAGYPMFIDAAKRSGYTNIIEYDNMEGCVKAVYDGEVTLAYIISVCEGYLLDHVQYSSLRSMILQDTRYGICVGVYDVPETAVLLSVINKCISALPGHEINEMFVRNTADAKPKLTFADKVAKDIGAIAIIGALLIAAVVLAVVYAQKTRQRRQLEEKRRQHSEFLQHLYDTLPCGVLRYAYEPPHTILSYNAACAKLYGYDGEVPFLGKPASSAVPEDEAEAFLQKFALREQSDKPVTYTFPITRRDGSLAYTECVMDLVTTESGKVFQEVFIDETERKQREIRIEEQYANELSRKGKRAEGLLYTACVNVTTQTLEQCDLNADGIYEGMPVEKFVDAVAQSLSGMHSELWLEDFRSRFSCERSRAEYESGNYEHSFTVCRRNEGRMQWLRVDLARRLHPAGDLMCFAYLWDITDEHISNDIMRRLAFSDCERFMSVDMTTGRCLQYEVTQTVKPAGIEALYGETDIINDITKRMTEADAAELRRAAALPTVAERLKDEERYHVYATLAGDKGERVDKALCYFYTDEANGILAVTVADVTEVRRDEVRHAQLLADALASAERADMAKSQFLSRVSHEIRTPLNAIIGFMELAKGSDEKTMASYLASSNVAAKQLLNIINDVLDMSSIESGKLKIANAPFNFKQLISSITNIYGVQCEQKGVRFDARITTPVDDWLVGDELRVNQILMNLLGNAIKFTSRGSISLTVSMTEVNNDRVFIRFVVSDTGCGMSEDMRERLFMPFEQENASTARKYGGSGLGLSIVKNLIGMMHGVIRVDSIQGEGATFTVDLPFAKSDIEVIDKLQGNAGSLRVLSVDDQESARVYMSDVLTRMGVRFTCVGSGLEALAELEVSERDKDMYNVCLIDWRMPTPDGLDTTSMIRKKYGEDVVVIVVSAYDYEHAGDAAREAGANMLLSKPIFQSTLYDLFMDITGGKIAKPEAGAHSWSFKGRRIILAEDNELNQIVAMGYLDRCGLAADLAENGQAAVDKFLASPPGYYDAILMDVQMPVLDGFEATRLIRASDHPQAKTISIIAQTANAFDEDIAKSLSAGMNAHVSKPINPETLYDTLASQMSCADGKPAAGSGAYAQPAKAAGVNITIDRTRLAAAGVDYEKGVERFSGKAQLYEKYLIKFLEGDPFAELLRLLKAGDNEAAAHTTHDLKGSTGNLNMGRLYDKMCELMELLRDGGGGDTAISLCTQAAEIFGEARRALVPA